MFTIEENLPIPQSEPKKSRGPYKTRTYAHPTNGPARTLARAAGLETYMPEVPCPRGHMSYRYVKYGQCKDCLREWKNEGRAQGKYKATPEKRELWNEMNRERLRLKQYGLTKEDFENLVKSQNNSCAICSKKFLHVTDEQKNRHIDHCHITGKVRGLLCGNCNTGLGRFKDTKELLLLAIKYLDDNPTLLPDPC